VSSRSVIVAISSLALMLMNALVVQGASWSGGGEYHHRVLSCASPNAYCAETAFQRRIWPKQYVGHDEPGVAFLAKHHGAGNQMKYVFTLPKDPPPAKAPGRSYNFETGGVFWFGMILCDTQSFPEQTHRCRPDSNKNITSLRRYPGSAYMEMQFYAPGWVDWPLGDSCGAHKWCAALNIDSVSYNPLDDEGLNDSCSGAIGGNEYVNFAFVTKDGRAQAPSNPVQSTDATITPDRKKDLFMNSGDKIVLKMHDTFEGFRVHIRDLTTGQTGFMTASKANGFAMVKYAPNPSNQCTPIPYAFHPMYNTATSRTTLPWGATQDNVEFVDEIGHFDWCAGGSGGIEPTGPCPSDGYEGINRNRASDYDDNYCFSRSFSSLVKINGCLGGNVPGYDGASYLPDWPDGNTRLHPGPLLFSSPHYGSAYRNPYQHAVLQTDLPAIEPAIQCKVNTGKGCSHLPLTDAGTPAAFYPFFAVTKGTSCDWSIGSDIPGLTVNDFGRNAQYGNVYPYRMLKPGGNGKVYIQYTGFRHVLANDPCAGR